MVMPNSDPNQVQGSGQPDANAGNQNTVPQAAGSSAGTQTPSPDAQEWEKKYKGLQTAYNKLDGQRQKVQDELNAALGTIEEQKITVANLTKQVDTLTASVGEKDKAVEVAKGEATAKGLESTRLKLIVKEFPELAAFEAQGVLPVASSEEEMRTKFTAFQTALISTVGEGVKDKLKGSSLPADHTKPVEQTVDTLYEQMVRLAGNQAKRTEYLALRDQYDALLAAQNAK